MIRELKQAEFLQSNRPTQEEAKTDAENAAFFTGFKGLFRKVIGQQQNGTSPAKQETRESRETGSASKAS